ncbi:MAG: ABC transporter permease [Bacteroidetes bacterium]|nr:ABC transporter permease [Bacteroidota bacterium]
MIKNYFKTAWRNIVRNKAYSIINILGLSLGVCSCIVIFLITSFEFSFDRFHPDGNRIYRIVGESQNASGEKEFVNNIIPDVAGFQNQIPGFETTAAFHSYGGSITIPNGSQQPKTFDNKIEGSYASTAILTWPSYFNIFSYQWLQGNPQSLNKPFKVVLTESRAKKYFGNIPLEQVIGKTVVYDDSLRVTVSGIVKDWTKNSDFNFTDFISVSTATHSFLKNNIPTEDWNSLHPHNGSAFVKLAKGVTPEQINKRFSDYIQSHVKLTNGKLTMHLQPLSSVHFTSEFRRGDDGDDFRKAYIPTLYVLMGIALFILIIAAVNFINLSTALSIQRIKEIGVRKVMGGSKRNITLQFLTETFILTFLAVIISISLVNPMVYLFKDFIPGAIAFHPFQSTTITFLVSITVATTLLAGFYPAKVLSSYLPVLSLKGATFQGREKPNLRKALIVFQFTMSLIFIIGVITIGKQINFMANADKGFNSDAIITINNWRSQDNRLKVLSDNIKNIRGVDKVLLQDNAPMGFAQRSETFMLKGKEDITLQPTIEIGNEDYIPFYQMKLIAGRNMLHSDSINELVINETMAKAIGFSNASDAVGKMLSGHPVAGVVADFHEGSFHDAILPAVIENAPDDQKRSIAIKLATNEKNVEVKAILTQIEAQWKKLYPDTPFDYSFLNQSISWLYGQDEKTAWLANAAALITIFISCMGLFGLGMFTAKRKTKEIGIRKVLGGSVISITTMLGKDFLKLIIISFFIALPIAYYFSNKWLQDFTYKTNLSWWVFALAGLLAMLIATITISFQSIKAAIANPVKSLRTE